MLSPAASTASSKPSRIQPGYALPLARSHPLKPGCRKEIALINYVDEKILRITRRYAKKFSNSANENDDTKGYTIFDDVVEDIGAIFDIVWVSGTPMLQVPYMLSLAGLLCSYMPAFPFSAPTFHIAKKLDQAFMVLLERPVDQRTDERLYQVSTTDRVRIKSLVEETRIVAVETASETGYVHDIEDVLSDPEDDNQDAFSTGLSKIYRHTMEILGDSLV